MQDHDLLITMRYRISDYCIILATAAALLLPSFAFAFTYADLDNDGMFDNWEIANGLNPSNPADASLDGDKDTLSNLEEHWNDTNPNVGDSDGDWLSDGKEVSIHNTNPNSIDTDVDGTADFAELFFGNDAGQYFIDADSDGMPKPWELLHGFDPDNGADASTDTDNDGLSNLSEYQNQTDPHHGDSDGDWLSDGSEVLVYLSNPNAKDTDNDGMEDFSEAFYDTDILNHDTDNDGMDDGWETDQGLDPKSDADAGLDFDNDGLNNLGEFQYQTDPRDGDSDGDWLSDGDETFIYGSNPNALDTDNDGDGDFSEAFYGTDPTLVWSYSDSDADKIDDEWEASNNLDSDNNADAILDTDNDSFTNYEEFRLNTDPNDPTSFPTITRSYNESFETQPAGNNWKTFINNAQDRTWDRYCRTASSGACSLASGTNGSVTSWVQLTSAGQLSFSWKTNNGASLEVYLDGSPILSHSGTSNGWQTETADINEGIHEIEFIQTAGSLRDALIDEVRFSSESPGLTARPQNLTCVAPGIVSELVDVTIEYPYPEAEENGNFYKLTKILQAPNDNDRWYMLEQEGLIKYFDIDDPGNVVTFLDFTDNIKFDGEMGLLGFTFDPDFPDTPEVYVTYVGYPDPVTANDPELRLSRITVDNPETPVNTAEEILLRLDQDTLYHQSGDIRFGEDDMLWMSVGDDSKATEAQDTSSMYGSILRIDVRGVNYPAPGYNIPAGNAFDLPPGQPGYRCSDEVGFTNPYNCPEIWAWGFRNAWRWSFDTDPSRLWVGDVGYNDWEEVSIVEAGKNYGWGCWEGTHENILSSLPCTGPFEPPVFDYSHAGSNAAVIGGFIYRGDDIPALQGRYVFADVMTGRIYTLTENAQGTFDDEIILQTVAGITNLAEGPDHELYFTRWIPGRIGKLAPASDTPILGGEDVATKLIDTGCVDPANPTKPSSGFVPYDVHAKLWSDGAEKNRAMAIPDGTYVSIDADGDFIFPVGSVLYKDFWINNKIIETRLLMYRDSEAEPEWEGFSYEWNEEQTEAELLPLGKIATIDGQEWTFPNQIQCNACHTAAAGKALGPEVAQLNHDFLYTETGEIANQLATLEAINYLSASLGDIDNLTKMPDPYDTSAELGERARAYLHANCAGCHRPGSVVPSPMDFRYGNPLDSIATCDELPGLGDLGIGPDARLIAPGSAANSVIVARMNERNSEQMPPLGTALVDEDAVQLISDWINGLSSCSQ